MHVALMFLTLAAANVEGATEVLTLERVLALAESQGPDALIAEAQVSTALAQRDRAASALLPSLTFSTGVSPGAQVTLPLLSRDESGLCTAGNLACSVGATPVGSASTRASVDLRWRVFDFGATQASVDAREANLTATQARAHSAVLRQGQSAVRSFLSALAARDLVVVREQLYEERKKQADVVRQRAALGDSAQADVLQTEVAAEAAAFDLEVAKTQAQLETMALLGALGLDPHTSVALDGTLDLSLDGDGVDVSSHPELRAIAADRESADFALRQAERALWPTIDAQASAGASLVAITKPDANFTPSIGAGLSLSWPLLDFGRGADVRAAEASRVVADKTRHARMVALTTDAARAQAALQAQTALVERATRLRDSARTARDVVQARLEGGASRLGDLVDAQAALAQAEASLVQARANRAAATVDLAAATGTVGAARFR